MNPRYWAVVPAAGIGRRMDSSRPKQYLEVAGKRIIEHALDALGLCPRLAGVAVAIAANDPWWPDVLHRAEVIVTEGGAERCHSVLNGLVALEGRAAEDDWVLVHDAARPCLAGTDIDALINNVGPDDLGGLLGVPLGDTLKRVSPDGAVEATLPRDGLWRALTPQMFKLRPLREALSKCIADNVIPTDECQAMELFGAPTGHQPRMIEGAPTNIKVTRAGDLELVAQYFQKGSTVKLDG